MRRNRKLAGERILLYTPIGLQLIDDLTGRPPIGRVDARLQLLASSGDWIETGIQPRYTASGVLMYPNLGKTTDVSSGPRSYRLVLESEFYRPFYTKLPGEDEESPPADDESTSNTASGSGLRFRAFPFNDQNPLTDPAEYAQTPRTEPEYRFLLPAVNYPFPSHFRVVRGFVGEAVAARPIANATVRMTVPVSNATVEVGVQKDRVLTNGAGEFALPVRWLKTSTTASKSIDSNDEFIEVNVVAGLGSYAAITIDGVPPNGDPTVFRVSPLSVGSTTGMLRLSEAVGRDRPIDTEVHLHSFNLHVNHEQTNREKTQAVPLSEAFTKRQTITLNGS